MNNKETISSFFTKVLNGTATASIIALIPFAVLGLIFKQIPNSQMAMDLHSILEIFQYLTPIMVGFLIARNFNLDQMEELVVGGAAFIGSGSWIYNEVLIDPQTAEYIFQLRGIGDLINTMITASLAVIAVKLIGKKLGSLKIILLPIIIGAGVGYIGFLILPTVSTLTSLVGEAINTFATLQPYLMSILISMSFAILIVTPMSTVAIGIAIGLSGLSAAAASMGIAATTAVLIFGTVKRNPAGVPLAIGLGAMKMMMPNFLLNLKIGIPMLITAAISGLSVPIFNLVGTPASSGFGLVGLVGPIASLESPSVNVFIMILSWFIIPFVVGFFSHFLCEKVIHLYEPQAFVFKS